MTGSGTYRPRDLAITSFAHHLVIAIMNLELHPPGSPHVQVNLDDLLGALGDAEQAHVAMPLRLDIAGDQLQHENWPLPAASLQAGRLLRLCKERRIESLAFDPKLDGAELLRFLVLLNTSGKRDGFDPDKILAALGTAGIRHVLVSLEESPVATEGKESNHTPSRLADYQAMADCLQDNHVRAFHGRSLDIDNVMGNIDHVARDLGQGPSGLLSLATQDNIDSFTVGHSVRVALLALQVARAAKISHGELIRVGTAALLHDIGKSKVPQEILFKPDRLNNDEWQAMAQHPRLGAEILLEQRDLDPSAVGAAFCHHLAPKGLGYPQPEFAFEPSGVSKLVRVCDVFEALTSVRPYKKALSPIEAYTVMFRNLPDFDTLWLRFFVRALGIYPVGLKLRLASGQKAVVISHGPSPNQPAVRIQTTPDGNLLPPGAPDTFVIGMHRHGVIHWIDSVITHDRVIPLGDEQTRILTQHPHGACLGGLDQDQDPLPQ